MVASPKVVAFVYQGLADVSVALDLLSIPWCVTCGTLLGGVRDKGFLAHDNDADIFVFATNRAKFSYRAQEVLAGRGNAMNDDVVGQFDINPLDDVAARTELFAVVATDQSQADASALLSGDADASERVDVLDLLHVLSNFGRDCEGMTPCEAMPMAMQWSTLMTSWK